MFYIYWKGTKRGMKLEYKKGKFKIKLEGWLRW